MRAERKVGLGDGRLAEDVLRLGVRERLEAVSFLRDDARVSVALIKMSRFEERETDIVGVAALAGGRRGAFPPAHLVPPSALGYLDAACPRTLLHVDTVISGRRRLCPVANRFRQASRTPVAAAGASGAPFLEDGGDDLDEDDGDCCDGDEAYAEWHSVRPGHLVAKRGSESGKEMRTRRGPGVAVRRGPATRAQGGQAGSGEGESAELCACTFRVFLTVRRDWSVKRTRGGGADVRPSPPTFGVAPENRPHRGSKQIHTRALLSRSVLSGDAPASTGRGRKEQPRPALSLLVPRRPRARTRRCCPTTLRPLGYATLSRYLAS